MFALCALIYCLAILDAYGGTFKIATPIAAKSVPETENLIIRAYQQLGIAAEIIRMPAKRSLIEASKNTWVDAELARVEAAQGILNDYIKVPFALRTFDILAYSNDKLFSISSWAGLRDYKVVTLRGLIGITLKLKQQGIPYHDTTNVEQIFKMLESGRAEVALLPGDFGAKPGQGVIGREFATISKVGSMELYHFIHKRHSDLVPDLTQALKNLRRLATEKEKRK